MDTVYNDQVFSVLAAADWSILGSEVTMTNLSANATDFFWDFGDGNTSTEINPVHTYLDGQFFITLIASNECDADTFQFEVIILTSGIHDDMGHQIQISPNPTSGLFTITLQQNADWPQKLVVYSATGQPVLSHVLNTDQTELDMRVYPAGIYFIRLAQADHTRLYKLILK
jgi:PKD repeat protein